MTLKTVPSQLSANAEPQTGTVVRLSYQSSSGEIRQQIWESSHENDGGWTTSTRAVQHLGHGHLNWSALLGYAGSIGATVTLMTDVNESSFAHGWRQGRLHMLREFTGWLDDAVMDAPPAILDGACTGDECKSQ